MKKLVFLSLLCFGIQAQAPHRFGAIDGVTIPDWQLNTPRERAITTYMRDHYPQSQQPSETEIQQIQDKLTCSNLGQAVSDAAEKRAKSELSIFVTDAEVEATRQRIVASAPNQERQKTEYRERLQALIAGLSAVYDQGRDPQQVYQELVAPHKVGQSVWAQNLYTGKTKEARQRLEQQLAAATPEGFDKAAANFNARPATEYEKLNAAIDAQLALSDPKFKADLDQYNANVKHPTPNQTSVYLGSGVKDYVDQKRAAWWQAERAKLSISLSDPSLYTVCRLATMGVTAPAH